MKMYIYQTTYSKNIQFPLLLNNYFICSLCMNIYIYIIQPIYFTHMQHELMQKETDGSVYSAIACLYGSLSSVISLNLGTRICSYYLKMFYISSFFYVNVHVMFSVFPFPFSPIRMNMTPFEIFPMHDHVFIAPAAGVQSA